MHVDRRHFLKAAAAGTAVSALPTRIYAQAPRKVTFMQAWLPDGSNMFIYAAKNKGFYKKRGIDVMEGARLTRVLGIGLIIGLAILFIAKDATMTIWYRLMDAVDPGIITRMEHFASEVDGVEQGVRLRPQPLVCDQVAERGQP